MITFSILELSNSSAGLGGIGPDKIKSKLSISVLFITLLSSVLLIKTVLRPDLLSKLKSWCNLGFLRSAPIKTVFLPEIAKIVARFIEQKVFPSPPLVDVTLIIFLSFSELMY